MGSIFYFLFKQVIISILKLIFILLTCIQHFENCIIFCWSHFCCSALFSPVCFQEIYDEWSREWWPLLFLISERMHISFHPWDYWWMLNVGLTHIFLLRSLLYIFLKSRIDIESLQIPLRSVELLVPFSFINIQTYVDNYIYDT